VKSLGSLSTMKVKNDKTNVCKKTLLGLQIGLFCILQNRIRVFKIILLKSEKGFIK
jgi:hypothetical protein